MTKDVEINQECCVRRDVNGTYGKTLNLRVGEPGWHKESTNLSVEAAISLRRELDLFLAFHGI